MKNCENTWCFNTYIRQGSQMICPLLYHPPRRFAPDGSRESQKKRACRACQEEENGTQIQGPRSTGDLSYSVQWPQLSYVGMQTCNHANIMQTCHIVHHSNQLISASHLVPNSTLYDAWFRSYWPFGHFGPCRGLRNDVIGQWPDLTWKFSKRHPVRLGCKVA